MDKLQIINIIELLSEVLVLPFQYFVECYFYNKFLGFKKEKWKFGICLVLLLMANKFILNSSNPAGVIIDITIEFIFIWYLCLGSFVVKLYAVIVKETILLLISLLFLNFDSTLINIIKGLNLSFSKYQFVSFIDSTMSDIVNIMILFFFLRKICSLLKLKDKYINIYESLFLLIPCISVYGIAAIFFFIQQIKIDDKSYMLQYIFPKLYCALPFIAFGLLISIVITAYIFKMMLEGEDEHNKNMLMEQQLKHMENVNEVYSGIKRVMHDMNNHISCLKSLAYTGNIEEIKKYIDNLNHTVKELDLQIKTGNAISDAVVNEKNLSAKAKGIELSCDFMIPKESSLEPMDLCTILGNSLDNAIESCSRIESKDIPKKISIKSFVRDFYLIIEVSNTTEDRIRYTDGKIISTKLDKFRHGFGIANIEAAVKKYNGAVDIVEEKNRFVINMMLKIK